jgi:broad specificity phosphatase PhoE
MQGRIGGDTKLSPRGESYAQRLGALFRKLHPPDTNLIVWTSSLMRTQLTAAHIGRPIVAWKALDEIGQSCSHEIDRTLHTSVLRSAALFQMREFVMA